MENEKKVKVSLLKRLNIFAPFGKLLVKMKVDPKKIKKNYLWIALGVLVLGLILARSSEQIKSIIFGKKEDEKEKVEFLETIPVKVYKVKRMDFKDTLPVMGRIQGAKEIELKFEENGMLESFNFEEGERILEGDIIASLNQRDSLLKLKYAALDLEKNKKLYELGATDKLPYEQKKLEYESAKRDLEKTNIYAPGDGYLGSKDKFAGAYVTSQDKIGTFLDYSKVYSVFEVIEEDSPKLKLGQTMEIYLDAYPGETFTGTVDMIAPMIEGRTRTQKIKVEIDNKDDMLRPGMFARAVINIYEKKDAMMIPASAFKKKEQEYFIYVVKKEEKVEEDGEEGAVSENPEEEGEKGKENGIGKEQSKAPKEAAGGSLDSAGEKSGTPGASSVPGAEPAGGEDISGEISDMGAPGAGEAETESGVIEEKKIEIEYLTHDMAEVAKGLEEGELIVRELHQEFKSGDKVEITEVQETLF
ncbi:MAG: efflux RND transporter periplasmic adaptor subunit [Candidatus Omnitrophica bacterium]|nr:efflux RND transporter periplasmic adaptor subunit [Candidatus Omnitrophota bacterium]